MKNLLLKIILAGLTLGLVPQGAFAMHGNTSTHSMQLRSRARSNSVTKISPNIDDPISPEEHHNFLNLYPNELDQKYAPIWKKRFKIWEKERIDEMMKHFLPPAPTPWQLDYYISDDVKICGVFCASILSAVIIINIFLNMILVPNCPSINPTYKEILQISTRYSAWLNEHCILDSKKYGNLLSIDQELQKIVSPAFTFMQLESTPQDGPTCAKYAFANLAAIDKLHREKRSIRAETIAQEIQLPLNVIGLPGQITWKSFDTMKVLSTNQHNNDVLNYAKNFFPKNNLFMWWSDYSFARKASIELGDIKIMINAIIAAIEIHGIAHIYTVCSEHATAISIIKEADNKYLVIYMNSHNTPLSHIPQSTGWDATKKCYQYLKNFTIDLRNKLTPKTAISLNGAAKN